MTTEFSDVEDGTAGVLSGAEIKARGLVRPCIDALVRGAGYDVRVARDGLQTPEGEYIEAGIGVFVAGPIVLHPGDSAWLSTHEEFSLPRSVSGIVTLKGSLANQGLLLLSGSVVDPLYGAQTSVGEGSLDDRRLHFFVANFGDAPVTLHPKVTRFATVQFLTVAGVYPSNIVTEAVRSSGRPTGTLGFFDNVKRLQDRCATLEAESERSRGLIQNLIVLGYFVMAAAVISAALATILTITADGHLPRSVKAAVPNTPSGKALLIACLISVAWIVHSIAVVFRPRTGRAGEEARGGPSDRERARRYVEDRARYRVLLLALIPVIAGSTLVWVARRADVGFWPLWPMVGSAVLAGAGAAGLRMRRPVRDRDVRRELDRMGGDATLETARHWNLKRAPVSGGDEAEVGDELGES